jgi:hypothetical protein
VAPPRSSGHRRRHPGGRPGPSDGTRHDERKKGSGHVCAGTGFRDTLSRRGGASRPRARRAGRSRAAGVRPSTGPRGREHPYPARGGRRVRAAGHALLDRQGLVGTAAARPEGVLPRPDSLSAPAHRHGLQVPRDDRVPRLVRTRSRRTAHRPHQPAGARRGHAAVCRRHPALLRAPQDAGAARRDRRGQLRRRVRRRAARRGAVARQGAGVLAARPEGALGSEAAAPGAVAPAEQPHRARRARPRLPALELDRARRVALHPRRADPGRADVFRAGARGDRPGQLPHHGRTAVRPAAARRAPAARRLPDALARLLPVHGRRAIAGRHDPRIIEELVAARHSERQLRVIDHDQDGSMEIKKREGYF